MTEYEYLLQVHTTLARVIDEYDVSKPEDWLSISKWTNDALDWLSDCGRRLSVDEWKTVYDLHRHAFMRVAERVKVHEHQAFLTDAAQAWHAVRQAVAL